MDRNNDGRIGSSGGFWQWHFGFRKMRGISWLSEGPSVSPFAAPNLPACQSALQPWVSLGLYNQSPPGVRFLNRIIFYGMGLLPPCPAPIPEDQSVSLSLNSALWPYRHGWPCWWLNYRQHYSPGHRVAQTPPPRQDGDTFGRLRHICRVVISLQVFLKLLSHYGNIDILCICRRTLYYWSCFDERIIEYVRMDTLLFLMRKENKLFTFWERV
jgi:hypothetical protein